jgi:hypothetical protein
MKKSLNFYFKWLKLAAKNRRANLTARANLMACANLTALANLMAHANLTARANLTAPTVYVPVLDILRGNTIVTVYYLVFVQSCIFTSRRAQVRLESKLKTT